MDDVEFVDVQKLEKYKIFSNLWNKAIFAWLPGRSKRWHVLAQLCGIKRPRQVPQATKLPVLGKYYIVNWSHLSSYQLSISWSQTNFVPRMCEHF